MGSRAVAHRAHTDVRPISRFSLAPLDNQHLSTEVEGAHAYGEQATASLLGKIFNATIASHISNVWTIPTDCPQREKRGWMGDAGLSSASLNTFYDAFAFHANFLQLIRDNQKKMCVNQPTTSIYGPCKTPDGSNAAVYFNGSVPDVTPFATGPYGGNPGTTDWQAAYPMVARALLLHSGKLALPLLADLWASLDHFMDYLGRLCDKQTGLLLTGARGDWVPPEGNFNGAYPTSPVTLAAFTHTLCLAHMAEIAQALGRTSDFQRYSVRLAANKKAYHAKFYNDGVSKEGHGATSKEGDPGLPSPVPTSRCCYGRGSQTDNVFALYLGAVPPTVVNRTVAMLVASIYNHSTTQPSVLAQPSQPPQVVGATHFFWTHVCVRGRAGGGG